MEVIDEKTRQEMRELLGGNIMRLREERNLKQQDLADKAGISRIQLSRLENSHMEPTATVLFAIADALGVPADFLRNSPVNAA